MSTPRPSANEPTPEQGQGAFKFDRQKRDDKKTGRRRIVLACDWLVSRRGGEAVLERLAAYATTHHAPAALLTLFARDMSFGPAIDALPTIRARLGRLPGASGALRRWLLPLYPTMIADLNGWVASLHEDAPVDLLLSSSSGLIKNLRPPPGVNHLCYCHTPARYLWSQTAAYGRGGSRGAARGLGLTLFGERLRTFDRSGTRHVSAFIANSTHTRAEIERCFNREAHIVPPPVRTEFFTPDAAVNREDFWLIVSALEPYKRVDLAIEAAARARQKLIVVGEGSQAGYLRAHARAMSRRHAAGVKGLIEFTGRIDDEPLRNLYRRAGLFLFPQIEDFGITAVEAQACGCPVVARGLGGALDTVIEDTTGALFEDDSAEALIEAARGMKASHSACRRNAERFSEQLFDQRMGLHIESALG
ncbi:MAG: glycosyltransferase [Phycisphaeraceae bacterium]|nr:glycosyltransferase [Phycisphaeraceae bacterium]MCW5762848.1 glycosyltransferase [Phycisphaeraceae bacterium]